MDHLLRAPKMHALFLPEKLVEDIPKAEGSRSSPRPGRSDTAQEIAGILGINEDSLMKEQVELLKKAEEAAAVEALKKAEEAATVEALKAAEQSIDLKKQQEYYEQLEAETVAKAGQQGDQNEMENPDFNQQQELSQLYEAEKKAQVRNDAGGGLGDRASNYPDPGQRQSNHIYDDPPKSTPRHEGRGKAQDRNNAGDGLGKHRDSYPTQHPLVPQVYKETKPTEVKDAPKADYNYPHADHPPSRSQSSPQVSGKDNLKVGSPVQLPAVDGGIKHGTIRWIGLVPNVSEAIAGIEMVNDVTQNMYTVMTPSHWFIL